jgi:hypothetical protein
LDKITCCKTFTNTLKKLFSFKMLRFAFIILPTASFTAFLEVIVFVFLFFNTIEKTVNPVYGVPYLVLISYYGSIFFINLF